MLTEVRLNGDHVELWYNGRLIGEVVGMEGTGVRIESRFPMLSQWQHDGTVEVRIASEKIAKPRVE